MLGVSAGDILVDTTEQERITEEQIALTADVNLTLNS